MNLLEAEIDPMDAGFDPSRLQRMDDHFAKYVIGGRLAGWQLALTRGGKQVHSSALGRRDREATPGWRRVGVDDGRLPARSPARCSARRRSTGLVSACSDPSPSIRSTT